MCSYHLSSRLELLSLIGNKGNYIAVKDSEQDNISKSHNIYLCLCTMMLSWLHSKTHMRCAIMYYAALVLVVSALITPAMSVPIPSAAATEQEVPPSQPAPKSSKKKVNPPPATDNSETIKVSSKLMKAYTSITIYRSMHVHGFSIKFD